MCLCYVVPISLNTLAHLPTRTHDNILSLFSGGNLQCREVKLSLQASIYNLTRIEYHLCQFNINICIHI